MTITRFAPSPTGFLHIGSARTALFSWAYARKQQGKFILRIEDTDLMRSTEESVTSIIDAMHWLGLDYDAGPFYQTQRMERYKEAIQKLLDDGKAYRCYCSKEELDVMREQQKAQGLKPKYDRRCLHGSTKKDGVSPVIRFKNPETGSVLWDDLVKGKIEINNMELDDLIIARSDGTPTYNFCVVIDDLDMKITHVIRGDDHVNNTPRQINILQAFNVPMPLYAHVPMILRDDGHKMSKRTDAVSVMQYKEMGILPEALLNYLARLCWGHGDEEIFSLEQFVEWFDLHGVSVSPARFDMKKLLWVNAQHIKIKSNDQLAVMVKDAFKLKNIEIEYSQIDLIKVIDLVKPRVDNINNLVTECAIFYQPDIVTEEDKEKHLTIDALAILKKFAAKISQIEWTIEAVKLAVKEFCAENQIKMPQLGMPLRLKLCGETHTPSFDMLVFILGCDEVIQRINS